MFHCDNIKPYVGERQYHCSECNKSVVADCDLEVEIRILPGRKQSETIMSRTCECGGKLVAGYPSKAEVIAICGAGDYEHISESLGINPLDIEEHRKHWPNIEALPDGRLKFTSVKQQQEYANHFGLDKQPQRRR